VQKRLLRAGGQGNVWGKPTASHLKGKSGQKSDDVTTTTELRFGEPNYNKTKHL